jgi:hypothetical protein
MTTRELNRATLARQMLLAREVMPATKAVGRLVAMQAQLARPPFVGLWTRLEKFTRDQLIRAVVKKDVVRATSLRGTIHLMTAADFCAFRGAIQPSLTKGLQSVLRGRLDGIDHERVITMARRFFGKAPATFDAFRGHVKKAFPKGDERAMAYAVRLQLPLVQVPCEAAWGYDAAAHFALADQWLGRPVSTADAPATNLVKRYLAAYGPATIADALTWSGLAGLKETFETLRPSLMTFKDDRKREYFDLSDAPRPGEDAAAPVRFLPEFDTLMLAHADRSRFIADAHRPHLTSKNLQVAAVFLVDGMAAGTWKVERKRKTATLVLQSFGPLTKKAAAALEAEGDALLKFVEEDAPERAVRHEKKR